MEKPYNDSAWFILTCLTEVITIKDPQFVLEFYHNEIYGIPNVGMIMIIAYFISSKLCFLHIFFDFR